MAKTVYMGQQRCDEYVLIIEKRKESNTNKDLKKKADMT